MERRRMTGSGSAPGKDGASKKGNVGAVRWVMGTSHDAAGGGD